MPTAPGEVIPVNEPVQQTTVQVEREVKLPVYPATYSAQAYDDWRFAVRVELLQHPALSGLIDRIEDETITDEALHGTTMQEHTLDRKLYAAIIKGLTHRCDEASRLIREMRARTQFGHGAASLRLIDKENRYTQGRMKQDAVRKMFEMRPRGEDVRAYLTDIRLTNTKALLDEDAVLQLIRSNLPQGYRFVLSVWDQSQNKTLSAL